MRLLLVAMLSILTACSIVNDPGELMGGGPDGGRIDGGQVDSGEDAGVPAVCTAEDDCDHDDFVCEGGMCLECEPNTANCEPGGRCETDTLTSATHCGRCDESCPSGSCSGGECAAEPAMFVDLAAGHHHACVRSASGQVSCWGENAWGQVDWMAPLENLPQPRQVAPTSAAVDQVTAGDRHTCAILLQDSERPVYCWGDNQAGQSGDVEIMERLWLVTYLDAAMHISAGVSHTCAVRNVADPETDDVVCWGDNTSLKLGTTDLEASDAAVQLPGGRAAEQVTTGREHTCALATDGTVFCWGSAMFGQTGVTSGVSPIPNEIPLANVLSVSAGSSHTCAVVDGGGVRCWGANSVGQLGVETAGAASPSPETVAGVSMQFVLSVGNEFACVADETDVRCWGEGSRGRLGTGDEDDRLAPALVTLSAITPSAVGTGNGFACVLSSIGTVWCWGDNQRSQLGFPGGGLSTTPVPIAFGD